MSRNRLLRLLAPLQITAALGCAPAYHCYSGCYVNCKYCPPPPLPYSSYSDCACHSRPAEPYLHVETAAANAVDLDNEQESAW